MGIPRQRREPGAGLHTAVHVRRAGFRFNVHLRVGLGEVVAVTAPRAACRVLAAAIVGIVGPDAGYVTVDGRVLAHTATGVHVPAHARPISLLGREPLLFPGMSLVENVMCGPLLTGMDSRDAYEEADRRLRDVRMSGLHDLPLADATEEQAWRVALARALATGTDVLVLDDPLGGLDVIAAHRARALLRPLLWDRITVLLTPDPEDATALADRALALDLVSRSRI